MLTKKISPGFSEMEQELQKVLTDTSAGNRNSAIIRLRELQQKLPDLRAQISASDSRKELVDAAVQALDEATRKIAAALAAGAGDSVFWDLVQKAHDTISTAGDYASNRVFPF